MIIVIIDTVIIIIIIILESKYQALSRILRRVVRSYRQLSRGKSDIQTTCLHLHLPLHTRLIASPEPPL